MPLYKLTEKRAAKKAREEESGVAEIKAALGVDSAESDSDESESGSEDEDEDSDEDEDEDDDDEASDDDDDDHEDDEGEDGEDDDDSEDDDEEDEDEDEDSDSDESDDEDFPLTIAEAAESPIYAPSSSGADGFPKACVMCPDKVLKNTTMVDVHLKSGAHERALKRYMKRISQGKELGTTDPRRVVKQIIKELQPVQPSAPKPWRKQQKPGTAAKVAARKARKVLKKERRDARKAEKAAIKEAKAAKAGAGGGAQVSGESGGKSKSNGAGKSKNKNKSTKVVASGANAVVGEKRKRSGPRAERVKRRAEKLGLEGADPEGNRGQRRKAAGVAE